MGIFLNDHGLKETVNKHGSHNQSSHGRRGSKGGGSSSESAGIGNQVPSPEEQAKLNEKAIESAIEDLQNRSVGADMVGVNNPNPAFRARARGWNEGLEESASLVGRKKAFATKRKEADRIKSRPRTEIQDDELIDRAYTDAYADAIISSHKQYGELEK
jgi:hypothetical protein